MAIPLMISKMDGTTVQCFHVFLKLIRPVMPYEAYLSVILNVQLLTTNRYFCYWYAVKEQWTLTSYGQLLLSLVLQHQNFFICAACNPGLPVRLHTILPFPCRKWWWEVAIISAQSDWLRNSKRTTAWVILPWMGWIVSCDIEYSLDFHCHVDMGKICGT